MRKRIAVLATALAVMLAGAATALAITNGRPDGTNHPYVGLMVALDENTVPLWRCSGSLLSPTVFLTAAHCTEAPADHIEVWLAQGPIATDPQYLAAVQASPTGVVRCDSSPATFDGYPCQGDSGGDPFVNPGHCSPCSGGIQGFAAGDVGIVTLADPVTVSRYARLPAAGSIDGLKNKT